MIRAYVTEDLLLWNVRLFIVQEDETGQPTRILRLNDGDTRGWEDLPDSARVTEPTLTLPGVEARALLDALTTHYRGAEDTRALRRDYDNERARVDKLTGSIADIAQSLAGKPYVWPRTGSQGFDSSGIMPCGES